jgi:hypothetical protein
MMLVSKVIYICYLLDKVHLGCLCFHARLASLTYAETRSEASYISSYACMHSSMVHGAHARWLLPFILSKRKKRKESFHYLSCVEAV